MEIILAQTPQWILKINEIEGDNIEDFICGTKDEFVQWLISQFSLQDSKIYTWIMMKDRKPKGYVVMIDTRMIPVINTFHILYAYCPFRPKENMEIFEYFKEWALSGNVHSFEIMTKIPHVMNRYGFEDRKFTTMRVEF